MAIRKIVIVFVLAHLISGCSFSYTTLVPDENKATAPEPGKALVHFLRTSIMGGAMHGAIYDGTEYIGTISASTRIAYQATPGKHMFMVVGESADFLQAELLEGKTYYAQVISRTGIFTGRYSFRPMNGQVAQEDIDKWIKKYPETAANSKGIAWAEKHEVNVLKKRDKYLSRWHSKQFEDKQILYSDSGR